MSSYSSLNHLIPPSENTSILSQHYSNGVSLEEGKQASSSLLRNTGQTTQRSSSSASKLSGWIVWNNPKLRVLIVLLLFVLLTASFAVVSFLHYKSLPCTSSACVMTASRLLRRIDSNTSPCDDFYQFACGSWINQSININYESWNTLYETQMNAHDKIVHAIRTILDGTFQLPLNKGEKAAAELYRQCTDMDTLEQTGLATWQRFVDELGGWMPELNDGDIVHYDDGSSPQNPRQFELEDMILSAFNYSVFPLFWAGVEVNYQNSTSHMITIYEQLPILLTTDKYRYHKEITPEMIFNKQDGPPVTRVLQDIGEELAELLNFDKNDEKVKMLIANMIHLEYRITVSGSTFYKEKKERYEVMSIAELQTIAPALNWQYFFSRLVNERLTPNEPIAIKTGSQWIIKLSKIIRELKRSREGVAIIKNYIKWKMILFHLAYVSPKCKDGLLWIAVSLYSGAQSQRKEFCVLRLSGIFPLSLPSILRKVDGLEHSEKNKKLVEKMAEKISREYFNILSKSDILIDEKTRENVLNKIANSTNLISYPDKMTDDAEMNKEAERLGDQLFWSMVFGSAAVYREKLARLRLPVDRRDWVDTRPALSVPAHNYERNLIQIPFDSLRIPYADLAQMEFANYAGVGTIIGHELTHAFDNQGKLHGPTGNLGHWWSVEARRRFNEKEQCFIRQYAALSETQDVSAAQAGVYENIADNVGLKVAYEAWRRNGIEPTSSRIAGLAQYSQEQLFFLAYAQGWCALKSKQAREVHMEEKFRIVGSLQNSIEFANAWKCPSTSFMNPSKKCNLW